jgi:nucleotide-binding universal stress UspA family protein
VALHLRNRRLAAWRPHSSAGRTPIVSVGYRRILVPLAENRASEKAMDVACRLAAEHHASLTSVAVIEIPPLLPLDAHMIEEEDDAHRLLNRADAIADSYGVSITSRILRARDAAAAIADQAQRPDAEIVVIGSARKSRRTTHTTVLKTTIQDLLRKAPCRVMVVAAPAEMEAERVVRVPP